jgi:hypothetical protein
MAMLRRTAMGIFAFLLGRPTPQSADVPAPSNGARVNYLSVLPSIRFRRT